MFVEIVMNVDLGAIANECLKLADLGDVRTSVMYTKGMFYEC